MICLSLVFISVIRAFIDYVKFDIKYNVYFYIVYRAYNVTCGIDIGNK